MSSASRPAAAVATRARTRRSAKSTPRVCQGGPVLMLLDSASLYFRAFHGVPESVTGPDGTPVNAIRGFLDSIGFLVRERKPDRLVACLDLDWRPKFRTDAVPSYKAHRVSPRGGETVPDALVPQ